MTLCGIEAIQDFFNITFLKQSFKNCETHVSWHDAILGSTEKEVPVPSVVKIVPIALAGRKDKYT